MNNKFLAFSIGDGHVSKDGSLQITHCEEQKEYIYWKYNQLKEISNYCPRKIKNNGHNGYFFQTRVHQDFKEIRKKLYGVLNKKYLSIDVINDLTPFCLAILYLDDGSLYAKKRNGKIHAYDLVISIYGEKSECENLIDFLSNKYDIHFTLKYNKGYYSIRCGTKEAKKFLYLIRPEIPNFECFKNTKLKQI